MDSTNADKLKHGKSAQHGLDCILNRCLKEGYLSEIRHDYRAEAESYSDKQFYAPFVIIFGDGTKWALFTTTTMRTDRIKGQQWDAFNLKRIDSSITRAYLVYPDGISEKNRSAFLNQNQKYREHREITAIDAIVSQDQISNLIEMQAISSKSSGQIKDIQGTSYEVKIADILNNKLNLNKWKNSDAALEGMHYDVFLKIMKCLGLKQNEVRAIIATADERKIGKLPSGGSPKTDVLVRVYYVGGGDEFFTVSCKRSSEKAVSVHQYSADSFADVLDKDNARLRQLLRKFQECGSLGAFGTENKAALTRELAPYLRKLSLWVLSGRGGDGDPITQHARYIITYDNNDSSTAISKTEDYCEHLIESGVVGHFGTPFIWTYPSKRKGLDIQLKCKIIK